MRIRIGVFNLNNLAIPGETFISGEPVYSQEEYDAKINWIAAQLISMNADVVGFQEVFHEQALRDAVTRSGIYEDATLLAPLTNGTAPRVGLVSRLPIAGAPEVIFDFPKGIDLSVKGGAQPVSQFLRPVLKIILMLPNHIPMTLFVCHLKSKRPLFSREQDNPFKEHSIGMARALIMRSAEAAAMRWVLIDEMQDNNRPVVVIGDLNDEVHAVTTEIITGRSPHHSLSHSKKRDIWDVLLYSTYDIQARQSYRDVSYSHIHNGIHNTLDHILVSQEFYRLNPNRIGEVEYLRFLNDHLIDDTLTATPRSRILSDHGQVVATLRFRKHDGKH